MQFKEPRVRLADDGKGSRKATVTLPTDNIEEHAIVVFDFPEEPDETNAKERARVLAKAKELFGLAAVAL